jgi:hypothetical protein
MDLLMTVGIVLLIPWLLGLAGGFIHLLLVLAIIVILVGVINCRSSERAHSSPTSLTNFVAFSRGAVGILSERLRTCPWPTVLRTDGGLQFLPLCS